jgi:hypothetical protein
LRFILEISGCNLDPAASYLDQFCGFLQPLQPTEQQIYLIYAMIASFRYFSIQQSQIVRGNRT